MRKLTQNEINLINSDLAPFEQLIKRNGWMNDTFLSKYVGISFMAEEDSILKGANGDIKSEEGKIIIRLKTSILNNERERARTVYHELGHSILGLRGSKEDTINRVLESIVSTTQNNPEILKEESGIYLEGLKLLEEYLVEKFSMAMCLYAKGIPEPPKRRFQHPEIAGNYIYYATFDTNYGIFESLCDKLVGKTYGNLLNSIQAGFSEEFFTGFFEKYDNVELMKILGNLGHIKRAIYTYAGQDQARYTPERIHQILDDTNVMIEEIHMRQDRQQISPTDICDAGRHTMQSNPGTLSQGIRKAQGIFSRVLDRKKSREK